VGYVVTGPTNGMSMITAKQLCYPISLGSANGNRLLDLIKTLIENPKGSLIYPGSDGAHPILMPNNNLGIIFGIQRVGFNQTGVEESYYFDPYVNKGIMVPFSPITKQAFIFNSKLYAQTFPNGKVTILAQHEVKIDGRIDLISHSFTIVRCKIGNVKNCISNFNKIQLVPDVAKLFKEKVEQNFSSEFDFANVQHLFS